MEVEVEGHKWSMPNDLIRKLDRIKVDLRHNNDFVLIIDGDVGTGKSTLASQVAKYVDPTFDSERMCFEPDEFVNECIEAPKYTAVVLDEAYRMWSSLKTTSDLSWKLNAMMMEIRQKNILIIIVLPSYFDLNKTIAINRANTLINCYKRKNGKKGCFAYYSKNRKKYLYICGKKYYNYTKTRPTFRSTFSDYMPINTEVYFKKKDKVLDRLNIKAEGKTQCGVSKMTAIQQKLERDALLVYIHNNFVKMDTHISKGIEPLIGYKLDSRTISERIREFPEYKAKALLELKPLWKKRRETIATTKSMGLVEEAV